MGVQLGLWESIMGLLYLKPFFLWGLIPIGAILYWLFHKDKKQLKPMSIFLSILMYYYLCIILYNIVGIPTLSEFSRLKHLGEPLFNPNVSLIPFADGLSLSFVLNIFCFIPLGFLCPLISRAYVKLSKTVLLGFGLSLMIEISQLFTLYRATDIDDLITNVLGTLIGWLCFRLIAKLKIVRSYFMPTSSGEQVKSQILPIFIVLSAAVITFLS